MQNSIPPRGISRYCEHYSRATDAGRLMQIFQNSGQLAIESKNPETARNNFELAIEVYYQIVALCSGTEIERTASNAVQILVDTFPTRVCTNEAIGICEKADKLKAIKSKLKYLRNAQDILSRGLARQDTDPAKITFIYNQVVSYVGQAEAIIEKQSQKVAPNNSVEVSVNKNPVPAPIEFKFSCPTCSQHILVPVILEGTKITCPTCGHEITIPQPAGDSVSTLPSNEN